MIDEDRTTGAPAIIGEIAQLKKLKAAGITDETELLHRLACSKETLTALQKVT